MKILLIFSHKLTTDQKMDLQNNWKINKFLYLPAKLQNLWSDVPPEKKELRNYLLPVFAWMEECGEKGDLALIQGDYGAVFLTVQQALKLCLTPLYATTKRVLIEEKQPDGTIKSVRIFKHVCFRKYEKI
jgi:hypothetical protein